MSKRLKISGPRELLTDPRAHLLIYRQLSEQTGPKRQIKLGPINGSVEGIEEGEPLAPIVELIKSRASAPPRGGEVQAVADLTSAMRPIYSQRMSALNQELALALELEGEPTSKSTRDSFKPPAEVREAAREGLRLREEHGRGGIDTREAGELGIGSGVQRARDLASGEGVSLETLKKMRGFFSRHRRNKTGTHRDGGPSAGAIAWLLWGGDAGEAWALKTLKQHEQESKK